MDYGDVYDPSPVSGLVFLVGVRDKIRSKARGLTSTVVRAANTRFDESLDLGFRAADMVVALFDVSLSIPACLPACLPVCLPGV